MDESQIAYVFKKVQNGYVYRAPAPWLFSASPHYLVNETQKAEISQILSVKRVVLTAVAVTLFMLSIGVGAGAGVWAVSGKDQPGPAEIFLIALAVAASVSMALQALAWVQTRRLRPILATLPRTNERISIREMNRSIQKSQSVKSLILLGASQAFVFGCFMFSFGLNLNEVLVTGHASPKLYAFGFAAALSGAIAVTMFHRAIRQADKLQARAS